MNTESLSFFIFCSTSLHLACGGTPISANLAFNCSVFCSLYQYLSNHAMIYLPFNSFVLSFFVHKFIYKVLEQLLAVSLLDVLESAVDAHEASHLVELAHPAQVLPLVFEQLGERLFLLLPAQSRLVPLAGFLLVDVLVEGVLPLGKRLQGLHTHVMRGHTLSIVPTPGRRDTRILQSVFENLDRILLRKGL